MLIKIMWERGLREGLSSRIEEVYRKTRSKMTVEKRIGNNFWTAIGL